ncbi:MAG: hypothetical protein APF81_17820 [Desulfosporosinus sp. BRH_c37]|nr:MAG: hypothetical protein APF81_17820 [Desulfosporosinus sp. BRH_c37]
MSEMKMNDCIICNNNFQAGDIAPEEWCICINCLNKGFMVCKVDKKIFNINSVTKSNLLIDKIQTFNISGYDLLEEVTRGLNFRYENVCSNDCYNALYIDKCIEELKIRLNMIWEEESMPVFRNIVTKSENREVFKNTLADKITELENYKQRYLK